MQVFARRLPRRDAVKRYCLSTIEKCLAGATARKYEKLGNTVKEIQPIFGDPRWFGKEYYEDDRKKFVFELIESKGKCDLALLEQATSIEIENGVIQEVETTNVKSGARKIYKGALFADCTGDAVIARMAGAQVMYGREAKETFNESLGAKT